METIKTGLNIAEKLSTKAVLSKHIKIAPERQSAETLDELWQLLLNCSSEWFLDA